MHSVFGGALQKLDRERNKNDVVEYHMPSMKMYNLQILFEVLCVRSTVSVSKLMIAFPFWVITKYMKPFKKLESSFFLNFLILPSPEKKILIRSCATSNIK